MNAISLSVAGIFIILGIAFSTMLLAAILGNLKTARRFRQALNAKLSGLRLSRMLGLNGIDRDTYVHTQPVLDIEQQMQRCASCDQTQLCDTALAVSNAEADTDFCSNAGELQEIRRKLESAA